MAFLDIPPSTLTAFRNLALLISSPRIAIESITDVDTAFPEIAMNTGNKKSRILLE